MSAHRPRPKKGDLVKILTHTKLDKLASFVGTVLQCRYKTDAYFILPANSPFTDLPYWVGGYQLQVLEK